MFSDETPVTPLEWFREMIGYNPWTFNGCITEDASLYPNVLDQHVQSTPCNPVVKEWSWQAADVAGRAELRQALLLAEQKLERFLKYSVAPRFRQDILQWPRLADRRMVRWRPEDADGKFLNIQLPVGYIQAAGVETRTSLASGQAVVYSDPDGDNVKEVATIGPINYTGDPAEVALYFVAGDRYGVDVSLTEQWRIHPVVVTPNALGTTVTITAPAWILVKPRLQGGIGAPDLVIDSAMTVFAQTVDIYRRYASAGGSTTPTAQAVVTWQTEPCHGWWCCCGCQGPLFTGNIYDPAATATALARVGIRDGQLGHVNAIESVYNSATGEWSAVIPWGYDGCNCQEPDRVLVRSLAGYPLTSNGQMDPKWRKLVTILAAAELGGGLSGCKEANRQLFYWQQDLAKTGNDREFYATGQKVLNNPFGTRRGHVYVWSQIDDGGERQGRSLLVP